jgi:site-specific recombinase XerD
MKLILAGKLKYLSGKKGHAIYYHFTDQFGARQRISLKTKVDSPGKNKNGDIIFPTEAYTIAQSIDSEVRENRWNIPQKNATTTLKELLELFFKLNGSTIEEESRYQYTHIIGKFIDYFGNITVAQMDEDRLFEYRKKELARKMSPYTIAKDFRTMKSLFNFAIDKGMMRKNPVTKSLKVKLPDKQPVIYAQTEIDSLWEYLEVNDKDLQRQLEFLLLTGFRASDSCLFTFDRIDPKLQVLLYYNKKKLRDELFPLSDRLTALIAACPRTWQPRVFRYDTRHKLYHRLKDALTAVGITKKIALHNLKATYSTTLARAGADYKTLQELSHHKSGQTTLKHYIFVDLEEKRKMLNKVESSRKKIAKIESHERPSPSIKKKKAL